MIDYKKIKFTKQQVGLPLIKTEGITNFFSLSKIIDATYYPISILLQEILGFGFPKNRVKRFKEFLIPLADGAKLATDVYLPRITYKNYLEGKKNGVKKNGVKCPTVVIRLPYFKDNLNIIGFSFASRGYACVLQDIRGCAHSLPYGTNTIMLGDRNDGLETLKWITKQFWYDGKIGMWGASYFGQTQLSVSWDNNNLVSCLVPGLCSFSNMAIHEGGLTVNELMASFLEILYGISNSKVPVSDISRISKTGFEHINLMYRCPYNCLYNDPLDNSNFFVHLSDLKGKGFEEITNLLNQKFNVNLNFSKKDNGSFNNFIERAIYERRLNLQYELMTSNLNIDFSKIDTPMLLIAGWYDLFLEKSLNDFANIQNFTPNESRKRIKLIIGPWAHGEKGAQDLNILGGLIGLIRELLPLNWYEYWLKGKESKWLDQPAIWYYILGKNTWHYTNEWPISNTVNQKFYIHSDGKANSKSGNGTLSLEEPKKELPDFYKFHPLSPVLTKGGRNLNILKGGLNQRESESRNDVLVYTSDKLKTGIEVTGKVQMILYASSSAIDTDFMIKLVDVYPNGKAINILDDGIRARFRNGIDSPSLIEPDKIYEYKINLGNISIYFRKNHKIRVDITSSNFPKFDINSNLGGSHNKKGFVIAFQKVFHNTEYPSHILLPIILEK